MLASHPEATGDRVAVGWAQFGPLAAYPRALSIRERYPELPDSPAPWVVTCLQIVSGAPERERAGAALPPAAARHPASRADPGGAGETGWGNLPSPSKPADESDAWPLPLPKSRSED